MELQDFEYDTLPTASSVRLVELHGEDDLGLLQLSMRTIDLTSEPVYNCLSYTWGSPLPATDHRGESNNQPEDFDAGRPVTCNGKRLYVGQSLYDFLRALLRIRRAVGEDPAGMYRTRRLHVPSLNDSEKLLDHPSSSNQLYCPLWIDALSINQNHLPERSSQVARMGDIYRHAQNVIIWLGPEGRETATAVGTFSQLINDRREDKARYFKDLDMNAFNYHQSRMVLGVTDIPQDSWEDVVRFYHRTWFARTWIRQEAVLARRIVCFCGMWELAWDDLVTASNYISMSGWSLFMAEMLNVRGLKDMTSTPPMIAYVRTSHRAAHQDSLLPKGRGQLLLRFWMQLQQNRAAETTDARDKIYGLLGYAGMGNQVIVPDYEKPVWQVYAEVTRACHADIDWLAKHNPTWRGTSAYFDMLSIVDEPSLRRQRDLPSWVPDYSIGGARPSPVFLARQAGNDTRIFNAAGDLERALTFPDDLRLLIVKASRVDVVSALASSNEDMHRNNGSFADLFELVLTLPAAYRTGQPRFEAFWRTLICDCVGHQHPAPEETVALANRWFIVEMIHRAFPNGPRNATPAAFDQLNRHRALLEQLNAGRRESRAETERTLQEMRRRDAGEHQAEDFSSGYREWYSWRRLFRTTDGYLGIAAQSLVVGDEVWIVPGSPVPLILRPLANGRYCLIGDAYVHGIMKGEALDLKSWRLRDITLE